MDFESLQKSWTTQPLTILGDTPEIQEQLILQCRRQQRSVWIVNTAVTLAFVVTISVLAWVYSSFHASHTTLFGISLLFMALLMVVFAGVLWKGVMLKKIDLSTPEKQYIKQYLKTLYWRKKTITTYTWIYSILLWLCTIFYMADVLANADLLLKIAAPVATTIYIFGLMFFIKKKSQKKQIKKLDEMIVLLKKH